MAMRMAQPLGLRRDWAGEKLTYREDLLWNSHLGPLELPRTFLENGREVAMRALRWHLQRRRTRKNLMPL